MRFEGVLFDVGGTLIGPAASYGAVYAEILAEHGQTHAAEAVDGAIGAAWDGLGRGLPAGVDRYRAFGDEHRFWLAVVRRVLATLGAPEELAPPVLAAAREAFTAPERWQVYPDGPPLLAALRARGARLGVVSNWDSRLPALLAALDLAESFEVLVVSHLEGIEKPDPALFERALTTLELPAAATLYVGDSPALDRAGAAAAGIASYLVDRGGRLPTSAGALPTLDWLPVLIGLS